MGFFNKILEKLKLKKAEPVPPPVSAPAKIVASERPAGPLAAGAAARAQAEAEKAEKAEKVQPVVAAPIAVSEVDVVKHLTELSAGKDLNWKVSIVDLLKLLEIDSSREARNELATELGCPAELMHDSAKMNVWLHKEVLKKIAANGGNIPKELLD